MRRDVFFFLEIYYYFLCKCVTHVEYLFTIHNGRLFLYSHTNKLFSYLLFFICTSLKIFFFFCVFIYLFLSIFYLFFNKFHFHNNYHHYYYYFNNNIRLKIDSGCRWIRILLQQQHTMKNAGDEMRKISFSLRVQHETEKFVCANVENKMFLCFSTFSFIFPSFFSVHSLVLCVYVLFYSVRKNKLRCHYWVCVFFVFLLFGVDQQK